MYLGVLITSVIKDDRVDRLSLLELGMHEVMIAYVPRSRP